MPSGRRRHNKHRRSRKRLNSGGADTATENNLSPEHKRAQQELDRKQALAAQLANDLINGVPSLSKLGNKLMNEQEVTAGDVERAIINGLGGGTADTGGLPPKLLKNASKFKKQVEQSGGADTDKKEFGKDFNRITKPNLYEPRVSYFEFMDDAKERKQIAKPKYASDPARFQALAQHYLGQFNPVSQLIKLQELQAMVPFMLTDPQRKLLNGRSIKYGYGDLWHFLGYPFSNGMLRSPENPFYHPIQYPIPDPRANQVFAEIHESSPGKQLKELQKFVKQLGKNKNNKIKPGTEPYKLLSGMVFNLLSLLDPTFMSLHLPGQERPMLSYSMKNIPRKLGLLTSLHRIVEQVAPGKPMVKVTLK